MTPPDGQLGEFTGRSLLILAAAVGLSAGMTATMFYSLGAFIGPLQKEFGWSRGDISLAMTSMTVGLFLAGPQVGRLCDRFGTALVGSLSLALYGAAAAAMALTVGAVSDLWIGYFVVAVLGAGSTPIALVGPIAAGFRRQRGLALGIVLTGAGMAGFWVPNFVALITQQAGWRAAYGALGAVALLAAPLVWAGFRPFDLRDSKGTGASAPAPGHGFSAEAARRTHQYWLLSLMAFCMALGIAGIIVHLTPLFQDLGQTPLAAAGTASLVGLSSVVGRIAIGLLLDRFVPSLVSMMILALAMLGMTMLWSGGTAQAGAAVILLGLAAGAEIDLLAYLTAHFFGQRAYGAIYGWQYGIFALGYGFSPWMIGLLRDMWGNYNPALLCSAALMGFAALAALALGNRPPVASEP